MKGPFVKALREAHYAENDLKEAWDYANYVDPPPAKALKTLKTTKTTKTKTTPPSGGERGKVAI